MNKNVLIVMAVILTPIVILGALAMAGAENFAHEQEAAEGENGGEGADTETPEADDAAHVGSIVSYGSQSSALSTASSLMGLA